MSLRSKLDTMRTPFQQRLFKSHLYRRLFGLEDGKLVLEDLCAKFAWADRPTLALSKSPDGTLAATAFYEGQRSVWLYIQHQLRLSEAELQTLVKESEQRAEPGPHASDPLDMGSET